MYYYTYLLINTQTDQMYIGKRQSRIPPEEDTSYMGSSNYVPKLECDKIILSEFKTAIEAVNEEIRLHTLFDVVNNPKFYNRSKQTSVKFDTTGLKFSLTEEQKLKISKATKGVKKTLTEEQRAINAKRLLTYHTKEIRAKAAKSLKDNGSNKGIKNSQFKPWYISTDTVTHFFLDISKNEKALKENLSKKHYTDIQRKLKDNSVHKHKIYGNITKIGNLPIQYKI